MKTDPMLDPSDAAMLLIDHQTGLLNLLEDVPPGVSRANALALAKIAVLSKMPIITTTSMDDGPNGPILPEFKKIAPDLVHVPRTGQINAWDNPEYVKAVERTGRKTLIMSGILTDVCVAFPAITAVAAGYKVYAVVDASGTYSKVSLDTSVARMAHAGVVVTDSFALICEAMKTHARPDVLQWYDAMCDVLPRYKLLIESHMRAQEAAKRS